MFGFIQANINDLSEEDKQRYKAAYCGLCHVLGEKYGLKGRLSLSYDLTFLLLLLTSLYEPDEISGESRCVVHPMKKHSFFTNKYTEYAADMTIALTYHKCLDDWKDDKKASAKKYASMLEKSYNDIKNKWRVQISVMENDYNTALHKLILVPSMERNGRWYYLSAFANYMLGNTVEALEDIQKAVRLEPDNPVYTQLYRQFRASEERYSYNARGFNTYASGAHRICMGMCLSQLLCNICGFCRCI